MLFLNRKVEDIMTKKFKNEIKKLPKRFMAFTMIFAMLFSYFAPITNVFALQSHGEGQHCFAFDMDDSFLFC